MWLCLFENNTLQWASRFWTSNSESGTTKSALVYTSVGTVLVMWAISKIVTLSPFANLWSLINQIQMIVLIIVTQIYLPNNVVNTIIGNKIMINPFQYISLNFLSFYDNLFKWLDSTQTNNGLSEIGLDSGSAIINSLSLIVILTLRVIVHLLAYVVSLIISKWNNREGLNWVQKVIIYLVMKTLSAMTFGYYIRTMIESILILSMSTFSEIYNFSGIDTSNVSSLIACLIILSAIILFFVLSVLLQFRKIKEDDEAIDKFEEFNHGVMKTKLWQLYIVIWLIIKISFVLFIITISPKSPILTIQILTGFQIWYFIYVLIQRPYAEIKDNLVEIINEFILLFIYDGFGISVQKMSGVQHQVISIFIW